MNWRPLLLSGVFAAGLTLSLVPRAVADPPPWAGVWRHRNQYDGDHYDRPPYDNGGYYGRARYGGNYGQCRQIIDRINFDRSNINEIAPTGRHRKAMQWYKDDIGNAERELAKCRYGGDVATAYDPYYQPGASSDPYYGDTGQSFDWKHDWPLLLGQLLAPPR